MFRVKFWTDEEVNRLRSIMAHNLTRAQICAAFGEGRTVVSIQHRMHMIRRGWNKAGDKPIRPVKAAQEGYLKTRYTFFGETALPTLADVPGVIPGPEARYRTRGMPRPTVPPSMPRIKKPRTLEAYQIGGRGGWIHFGKGRVWREEAPK